MDGDAMKSVNDNQYIEVSGPFEARYLAFLETISTLRPSLHRYCARMTGSVMDGEDVVQEALFEAYRKLDNSTTAVQSSRGYSASPTTAASTFCDAGGYETKPRRLPPCQKLPRLSKRF